MKTQREIFLLIDQCPNLERNFDPTDCKKGKELNENERLGFGDSYNFLNLYIYNI